MFSVFLVPHVLGGTRVQMYQEMASRHRVRASSLSIIKTATVPAKLCKRDNVKQFHDSKISFPITHKLARCCPYIHGSSGCSDELHACTPQVVGVCALSQTQVSPQSHWPPSSLLSAQLSLHSGI